LDRSELLPLTRGGQECLLGQILGERAIADKLGQKLTDLALVTTKQLLKR
jgi:hypothetical protein